jgi:hypothetical protein
MAARKIVECGDEAHGSHGVAPGHAADLPTELSRPLVPKIGRSSAHSYAQISMIIRWQVFSGTQPPKGLIYLRGGHNAESAHFDLRPADGWNPLRFASSGVRGRCQARLCHPAGAALNGALGPL